MVFSGDIAEFDTLSPPYYSLDVTQSFYYDNTLYLSCTDKTKHNYFIQQFTCINKKSSFYVWLSGYNLWREGSIIMIKFIIFVTGSGKIQHFEDFHQN